MLRGENLKLVFLQFAPPAADAADVGHVGITKSGEIVGRCAASGTAHAVYVDRIFTIFHYRFDFIGTVQGNVNGSRDMTGTIFFRGPHINHMDG